MSRLFSRHNGSSALAGKEDFLGDHTVTVVDKPFFGYINRGAETFSPDFRSLRSNGSKYLFVLLDDQLNGRATTIKSPKIKKLLKESKDSPTPEDLSHLLMPGIIKVTLGQGRSYDIKAKHD